MGVQKEDVEKFLNGNPAFAKQYFAKKMSPASISKASGLPEKQIDFSQLQELSQVNDIISLLVSDAERRRCCRGYLTYLNKPVNNQHDLW